MDGPGQHVLERTSILFSDQVHTAGRSVTADSLLQVFDCDQQTGAHSVFLQTLLCTLLARVPCAALMLVA